MVMRANLPFPVLPLLAMAAVLVLGVGIGMNLHRADPTGDTTAATGPEPTQSRKLCARFNRHSAPRSSPTLKPTLTMNR